MQYGLFESYSHKSVPGISQYSHGNNVDHELED